MVFRGNGGGISGRRQRIKRELWKTDCRFTANKGGGGEGGREGGGGDKIIREPDARIR